MKKLIAAAALLALLACTLLPTASFTEDKDTIRLARTIYALGKNESYETKLALGCVVMNRLENPWFPDELGAVLKEQQQFPAGSRYDDASLEAAHAVLTGKRVLHSSALYYQPVDAGSSCCEANRVDTIGSYNFYSESGNV